MINKPAYLRFLHKFRGKELHPISAEATPQAMKFTPWLVWGLAAAFFLVDYFARVAPSVMAPDLMRAFNVTAFMIGGLSSFFYWPYIAMQIPVGLLVDRFGPKRLLILATLFCFMACVWFAASTSVLAAGSARALLGFASAFAFVGALKLGSLWFSARQFGLIAGTTQALGMVGASFGQAPMAYFVENFGWRETTYGVGCLFLILLLLIALLVRDHPNAELNAQLHPIDVPRPPKIGLWMSFKQVIHNSQTWYNGLYVGFLYAPTAALGELWGASFFSQSYAIPKTEAAIGTMLIFVGWGVGGPIAGWLSDRLGVRRPIMLSSAALSFILLSFIIYFPSPSFLITSIALFIYGVVNTGVGVAYAVAGESNPRILAGTSLAFANMSSIIIGALFQPIIGKLLDWQWGGLMHNGVPVYDATEFRTALLVLPLCLILSFLFGLKVKETYCRPCP